MAVLVLVGSDYSDSTFWFYYLQKYRCNSETSSDAKHTLKSKLSCQSIRIDHLQMWFEYDLQKSSFMCFFFLLSRQTDVCAEWISTVVLIKHTHDFYTSALRHSSSLTNQNAALTTGCVAAEHIESLQRPYREFFPSETSVFTSSWSGLCSFLSFLIYVRLPDFYWLYNYKWRLNTKNAKLRFSINSAFSCSVL